MTDDADDPSVRADLIARLAAFRSSAAGRDESARLLADASVADLHRWLAELEEAQVAVQQRRAMLAALKAEGNLEI